MRSEDPLRDLCLLLRDVMEAADLRVRREAADRKRAGETGRRRPRNAYAKVPPTQEG